ncbi:MAG: hypothetical protein JSR13_05785 [Proteobacteria bacterium]|nr:hypothetical protein [Pseudomonadota bacterium]
MSDIEEKCKFALQALNDWAVTYAPDMCSDESVARAKARIHEHGTLAYIANATDQLHAAIQLLSEAEKREREARAKALEDLAEWIEGQRKDVPAHGWEFAAAIRERALQSEER